MCNFVKICKKFLSYCVVLQSFRVHRLKFYLSLFVFASVVLTESFEMCSSRLTHADEHVLGCLLARHEPKAVLVVHKSCLGSSTRCPRP